MFPDFVGVSLIDAAVALGKGEELPPHYETPTIVVTDDNFATYYRPTEKGHAIDFDAVRRLMP